MPKSIGLQALRRNLSRVIGKVSYGGETYVIESYGHPAAVLLSIDEYQRLTAITLEQKAAPARIVSPRLANRAQATDFELEVVEAGPGAVRRPFASSTKRGAGSVQNSLAKGV